MILYFAGSRTSKTFPHQGVSGVRVSLVYPTNRGRSFHPSTIKDPNMTSPYPRNEAGHEHRLGNGILGDSRPSGPQTDSGLSYLKRRSTQD